MSTYGGMAPKNQNATSDSQMATELLAETAEIPDAYRPQSGVCCFCRRRGDGQSVETATSEDYFSDDPLLDAPTTNHVCAACAWVMDQRRFKQGHWLAHADGVQHPSTGELLQTFRRLRAGEYAAPLAVHVTSSPIRSSHAYLWTPVNETLEPLTVAYDRQMVTVDDWAAFEQLLVAVEDLRLAGFTFDELRSGEPRVSNVATIGRDEYISREETIAPHRRTARLELVLTLSRAADDQPRTDYTDAHQPLTP